MKIDLRSSTCDDGSASEKLLVILLIFRFLGISLRNPHLFPDQTWLFSLENLPVANSFEEMASLKQQCL